MKKKLILSSILILIFLFTVSYGVTTSFAFKDLLYDPRAMGVAGAMTALADSPTSAIYNPALMGEYSRLTLKTGFGLAPISNVQSFIDLYNMLNIGTEPPNGDFNTYLSFAGYLHLGISKLGITLFGDSDIDVNFQKYTSNDSSQDLIANVKFSATATPNLNGALTIAIPAIDLLGLKLNLGTNVRLNNTRYYSYNESVYVTQSGVVVAESSGVPNDNDIHKKEYYSTDKKYISIDLGAYMRFSPFVAVGIFAKDAYSIPLEGKEIYGYGNGYYDSNGNYYEYTPYSETSNPIEVTLPTMSLKAGAFIKVPVLSTRIAVGADLDNNLSPTMYRIGVEQPVLMVAVLRGGAILDTQFNPQLYTAGFGINLLLLQADLGVAFDPQDLTMPQALSISGSFKF